MSKKITQLSEATSVSNNDLLVIVDVANNETKKVKANLVGGNIPIQSSAPANPEENDLWIDNSEINTGTLKFYKNDIWKIVDGQITGDTLPIGAIMPFPSSTAPTNWLVCDGSAVSRTTYSELFSLIGTTFGSGDGSTTFNVPNLKGKVVVGQDTSDTSFDVIGETGGEKTHTLSVSEMPSHTHVMAQVTSDFRRGGTEGNYNIPSSTGTPYPTQSTGGGQAHNNLQPYQVQCYIIKAKQSAGVVGNVLTSYSTSTTDTYSCNYINNAVKDTYSTTEQVIGTWIDNKPIYRKVIDLGTLPNNTVKTVATGLTHSQITVINFYGYSMASNGYGSTLNDTIIRTTITSANMINISTTEDFSSFSGYAVMEYTKTTD